MKKARTNTVKSSDPAYDFGMAIDRLSRKSPLHPDLAKLNRQGKLKINASSVAKEADRSRTLISGKNCRYPDVALLIANCNLSDEKFPDPKTKSDAQKTITALRNENSILRNERDILATRLQDALNVVHKELKKDAAASRRDGRIARRGRSNNSPGGTSNVVNFVSE